MKRRPYCGARLCGNQEASSQRGFSHGHPLVGHSGVVKTLRDINSCFFWPHADREVRDYVRNGPSCQLQTTHPSKPAGLLQPLDVPPYAWHTVTTDGITGLPLTPQGNNAIAVFVK